MPLYHLIGFIGTEEVDRAQQVEGLGGEGDVVRAVRHASPTMHRSCQRPVNSCRCRTAADSLRPTCFSGVVHGAEGGQGTRVLLLPASAAVTAS